MGMEIQATKAAQGEETLISDKENKATTTTIPSRDNSNPTVPSADKETAKKEGGSEVSKTAILPPKDATDEWGAPKQTYTFYFAKIRMIEDPKIKTKLDQLHKTINNNKAQKSNLLSQLADKRKERNEIISQLKPLTEKVKEFNRVLTEKRTAMEPLRDELGKIRNETNAIKEKGIGLCTSVKELDDRLKSLEYRMSHESMSLDEEKRLMKEIKQLEGTRGRVIANEASRAKLDHDTEKDSLQDKVKLIGADMDEVRKEREAIRAKIKPLEDQKTPIDAAIKLLEDQLSDFNEKNKKAYDSIVDLNNGKESLNMVFTENRKTLTQAKVLASKKDITALEALASTEMEKFMGQWAKKAFRADYEKRILSSLDQRYLSRDGRIRNPDEKPIIAPEPAKAAEPEPTPVPTPLPKPTPSKHSKEKEATAKAEEVKAKGMTNSEVETGKGEKEKEKEKEKVDLEKLKKLKREEEIAKNKMALERKKKLAEKKLAKAEAKALKEAEEKLKKKEKKSKKKDAVIAPEGSEDAAEGEPNSVDPEEPEESKDESDSIPAKAKPQKESAGTVVRQRGGAKKVKSQLPRAILRKKKAHSYWLSWAPLSAVVLLVLTVLLGCAYYFKYYFLASKKIKA
ncbi:proton pump-interactor [Rhynchospora pubera]|uniref:Proton pump-interactor n=1 Tax=Rhynchospora pubera TaxID=906938 RepID=A0AAV8G3Q8_9POAL|nr:proton pump-interactor [Rhynchospora pubera]